MITNSSDLRNAAVCEGAGSMRASEQQINRQRLDLGEELNAIRQRWLAASRNNDYRSVARLTLEAARVNRSIAEAETQAELLFI